MSNKTRLQTNNNNLQSILDTVNSLPSGGSGGDSSSTIPTIATGFVNSTAAGSVIYTINIPNGSISSTKVDLTYFSTTKKYRHAFDESLVANTPIIVLTSGTITMPSASGYILETLASGTDYSVYTYIENGGSEPGEGEIPGLGGDDDETIPDIPFD